MTEINIALENARERIDSRRTTYHPENLPIEWMRYVETDACIAEWSRELSAATGRAILLDVNACARLQTMTYENLHMYLRGLTDELTTRDVRCPSVYLLGLLRGDDYRSDWPWKIYRRPWITPESHYVRTHYIFPFERTWQTARTPAYLRDTMRVTEETAESTESAEPHAEVQTDNVSEHEVQHTT